MSCSSPPAANSQSGQPSTLSPPAGIEAPGRCTELRAEPGLTTAEGHGLDTGPVATVTC